jgi:hypothetical protein
MKTFIATFLLLSSITGFAQTARPTKPTDQPMPATDSDTRAKPEAVAPSTTAQKQEIKPGIDNTYKIGPYDKDGKYNFYGKQEQQDRSDAEEKAETE